MKGLIKVKVICTECNSITYTHMERELLGQYEIDTRQTIGICNDCSVTGYRDQNINCFV